jgi:hypothetical protein
MQRSAGGGFETWLSVPIKVGTIRTSAALRPWVVLRLACGWRIVISPIIPYDSLPCYHSSMRHLVVLFIHSIAVLTQLFQPGGVRSLVAESLLLKHQLLILILNRSRHREGQTPVTSVSRPLANLRSIRWQLHCRALYQTAVAASQRQAFLSPSSAFLSPTLVRLCLSY